VSRPALPRLALAAAGLLAFVSCRRPSESPSAGTGSFESVALALVARYDAAWMKKDLPAIEKILAPSYVYVSSRGDVSDLAKTRALISSPGYRLERGRRDELSTHRFGQTVVVVGHWVGAGEYEGKPFEDDQRCSVVVGFADTAGRVLSEHCTNIPPK
jgi:hypothetical protein